MRRTIISLLEDFAGRGRATAFAYQRGLRTLRWSYAEVAATACGFARELEARGIAKGDRVLIWAANSPVWVAAFFGCAARGAIIVPLDRESAPDFIARVQKQVEAKMLLYGPDVDSALAGAPSLRLPLEDVPHMAARHPADGRSSVEIDEDDTVEIIFTSGTTAAPKGVVITHRNLLANLTPLEREIQRYLKWERLVHPIRFLTLVPLSHVFGQLMGMLVPPLLGGEVFFQDSLSPSEIISRTRRERISVIVAVPRLLDALRGKVEGDQMAQGRSDAFQRKLVAAEKWSTLRKWWAFRSIHRQFGLKFWAFISGGATLNEATETFWQRLGFAVLQGYGMTETASLVSVNHPFKRSRRSIGKTLPGQEVRLDANGEILVRGANVSPGYWRGEARLSTSGEGWLRTGDIGEMDAAGTLYFKGRKKEVIVTGAGLNIYPEDLEAALNRQPEVRASAVIPIDGAHGPEPLAVLVLRDERAAPEPIIRRANETLAQYQQIRRWLVWPEADFPRTTTGKIRKRELAEMVQARLSGDAQGTRRLGPLLEIVSRLSGNASGADQSSNLSTSLNLDSLGRVELLSALEDRYGIDLDEASFTADTTLGEIEQMIHRSAASAATQYPYPEWTQRFPVTWLRLVVYYLVLLPITRILCWTRVEGRQNVAHLRGPAIFVANHITMFDHALILAALPGRFKKSMAIAMDGERVRDWRYPPAGTRWFARLLGLAQYVLVVALFNVFPLPRKSGFRRSFAYAGESMDRGYSIMVFPEGKRTEDGRMNPFMGGIGLLTRGLNVPVVPVRIKGLFELKEERRHFAPPGRVSVIIGEPLRFGDTEDAAHITKELERRVAAL